MTALFLGNTTVLNTNAGVKTGSPSVNVGSYGIAFLVNTGETTAPTFSDNAGDGGTWADCGLGAILKNTSADAMWVYVRDRPFGASAITLTYTPGATDTGGGYFVYLLGLSGGGAGGPSRYGLPSIRQIVRQANKASGVTPNPAFAVNALPGNVIIGAVFSGTNGASVTQPSGFTESSDTGYTVPAAGLETVHQLSGFSGTTVTWGSAPASAYCDVIVEIDVGTVISNANLVPPLGQAVNRGATW